MIANFQTLEVALRHKNTLINMGYLSVTVKPYRGGHQVFTTGVRVHYKVYPWGVFPIC